MTHDEEKMSDNHDALPVAEKVPLRAPLAELKAISLWQPWASLWCIGVKKHETRHWATSYRGWLLVHAAKRRIDDLNGDPLGDICDAQFGHHYGLELPRGAIVGRVRLIACKPTNGLWHLPDDDRECGDFSEGRFAWQADKFETFAEPIPFRGAQGFFNVPGAVVRDAVERSDGTAPAQSSPRSSPREGE